MGVALAIGLIVGFERGWHGQRERPESASTGDGHTFAGIRTFALAGLFGGLAAAMPEPFHPWFAAAALLAVAVIATIGYLQHARATGDLGATTEFALLVTFALGLLTGSGHPLEAVILSVVVAVLLGFKSEIHATLGRLEPREIRATLQLLVLALVVLPLLPNESLGPFGSLNPRTIGLLVLLILGIGFVGYFAVRMLGTRAGLLLTAAAGGLTSSTAVTVSFARMATTRGAPHALLGVGIALACAAMAPRIVVEVAIVHPALLPAVIPPLAVLAVMPVLAVVLVLRKRRRSVGDGELSLGNPLQLRTALTMGLLLAVLFMLSRAAQSWFGDAGIYGVAALSGIADVDAITLALADQAGRGLDPEVAARGIVLAAVVNTAVKAVLAAVLGGIAMARWAGSILVASLIPAVLLMLWI